MMTRTQSPTSRQKQRCRRRREPIEPGVSKAERESDGWSLAYRASNHRLTRPLGSLETPFQSVLGIHRMTVLAGPFPGKMARHEQPTPMSAGCRVTKPRLTAPTHTQRCHGKSTPPWSSIRHHRPTSRIAWQTPRR